MNLINLIWVGCIILHTCEFSAASQIRVTDESFDQDHVANLIVDNTVQYIRQHFNPIGFQGNLKNVLIPIIPPGILPSQIPFNNWTYDYETTLLQGFYSHGNTLLEGLDTLSATLNLTGELPYLGYIFSSITELALRGDYILDLDLNITHLEEIIPDFAIEIPNDGVILHMRGQGVYEIVANQPYIDMNMNVTVQDDVIQAVKISIGYLYSSMTMKYANLTLNGNEIDDPMWEQLNYVLEIIVNDYLNALKPSLEPLFDLLFTELLQDCRVSDLIAGELSCTGLVEPPPEPDCSAVNSTCPIGQYCELSPYPYCRCEDRLYSTEIHIGPGNEVECRRIVGASCLLNPNDPEYLPCTSHSVCVAMNSTNGRCDCQTGFIGTEQGSCQAGFGQSCAYISGGVSCFEEFMLDCKNERCECMSPDLIFEFGRGCVAQLGEPCNIHLNIDREFRLQCASELECVEAELGRHICATKA